MNEEDENNEFNNCPSESLINPKKEKLKKKTIIMGVVSLISILILLLIIIIIIISSKTKNGNENENEIPKKVIGLINCVYDIQTTKTEINILSEEYNKDSNFDIFIEGKKIEFSKKI